MFVSDQIGGWLLVVSLEYILIPGDPSRGRRSRSDKWSGHGRYFVLLLLLLLSVSLSLFFLPSLPFLLFFWFTTLLPASFPRTRRRERNDSAPTAQHPCPCIRALPVSRRGRSTEWRNGSRLIPIPSDFSFLDRLLHSLDRLYRVF